MLFIVIAELRNLETVLEVLFVLVCVMRHTLTRCALKFDEIVL